MSDHRRCSNVSIKQDPHGLIPRALGNPCADDCINFIDIRDARAGRREALVVNELGPANRRKTPARNFLDGRRDRDPAAVDRTIDVAGCVKDVAASKALRHLTELIVIRRDRTEQRKQRLDQADVDQLPNP